MSKVPYPMFNMTITFFSSWLLNFIELEVSPVSLTVFMYMSQCFLHIIILYEFLGSGQVDIRMSVSKIFIKQMINEVPIIIYSYLEDTNKDELWFNIIGATVEIKAVTLPNSPKSGRKGISLGVSGTGQGGHLRWWENIRKVERQTRIFPNRARHLYFSQFTREEGTLLSSR